MPHEETSMTVPLIGWKKAGNRLVSLGFGQNGHQFATEKEP
jgi:hypothetical protein